MRHTIRYSKETLLELDNLLKSNLIRGIDLKGLLHTKKGEPNQHVYRYLNSDDLVLLRLDKDVTISVTRNEILNILYEEPLKNMPLYINRPIFGIISKLRLKRSVDS